MERRLGQLNEQQRKCLRLVGDGLNSKEIALKLGLSPNTVNRYIHLAMATLRVPSRRAAARELTAWESSPQYKRLIYKPEGIVAADPVMFSSDADIEDLPPSSVDRMMPRVEAETIRPREMATADAAGLSILPLGGALNDLTPQQRVGAILKLTFYSAITATATILVAKGAFSLLG